MPTPTDHMLPGSPADRMAAMRAELAELERIEAAEAAKAAEGPNFGQLAIDADRTPLEAVAKLALVVEQLARASHIAVTPTSPVGVALKDVARAISDELAGQ